jgi:mRNA interferase RelE/StbE
LSSYRLVFLKKATREWNKLGATIRQQFERKLAERLLNPRVSGDRIDNYAPCYKIKLKRAGYRLIYRVDDDRVVVVVVKIGQRERGEVYEGLAQRLAHPE